MNGLFREKKGCYFSFFFSLLPKRFPLLLKKNKTLCGIRVRAAVWAGLAWEQACPKMVIIGPSSCRWKTFLPLLPPPAEFFFLFALRALNISSFLDYVIGGLLLVEGELKGKVCSPDVRCRQQGRGWLLLLQRLERSMKGKCVCVCVCVCAHVTTVVFLFKLARPLLPPGSQTFS